MYNASQLGTTPTFPTFLAPSIDFQDVPDSCGGFTDCIEFVGKIIVNLVLGVVFLILIVVSMLIFLVALIAILSASAVTGIEGAPDWFNIIIVVIFGSIVGIIIYRSLRKGDTAA